MAARSENLGQDLKAWAAEQLQIEVGSAPAEVRAAYLRRVEHENGAANLTAREALLILTGRHNAARPALALEAAEEKLQREVEDFARRFFALPIAERKAEWDNLKVRGQGFVRVDARLAALRAGLYLVVPHYEHDSDLGKLVSVVCELFVLRPAERAARRQAFLAAAFQRGRWSQWVRAATLLRKNHKAIASLEPEVIARLADADALAEEKQQLTLKMRKFSQPVASAKKGSHWWVWIVVSMAVLRGLAAAIPSSKPAPSPTLQRPDSKPAPNLDADEFFKKNKLRLQKNGERWDLKVIPEGERFWEDNKAKPAEGPKDRQDPP